MSLRRLSHVLFLYYPGLQAPEFFPLSCLVCKNDRWIDSFETCTCLSLGRAKPRLIVSLKNLICFCRDRHTNSKNRPGLSSSNSASPKCHLEAVRIQFLFILDSTFYWAQSLLFSLVTLLLWTKPKPLEVRGGMGRDTFPAKFYPCFNFSGGIFFSMPVSSRWIWIALIFT